MKRSLAVQKSYLWQVGLVAALFVSTMSIPASGADLSPLQAQGEQADWPPQLYGLCVGMPNPKGPSIPEQVKMLKELGFDGIGMKLLLDKGLDEQLRLLDEAGLQAHLVYTSINLKPGGQPYDPRLPAAIRKLKGRPVSVCVLLQGLPPADKRGDAAATNVLRELGDVAAESDVRISIYHHTGDWTESLLHAIEVVKKADHPQVGVNFNLCHWLKIDHDKDYPPVLRGNSKKIFTVTINGAQLGSTTWTNGLIQPLDKGDFDNRELLKILREIGYSGSVGLMCYGIPGEPRDYLERSMAVWRKLNTQ